MGPNPAREPNRSLWGVGATIVGRHYDVIIMDDIINEQSCSTPEQIRKVRDWYSYIQSIKDPEGFELMIGTRYHFSDIYGTVIKECWYKDRVYIRRAVEDGKPIYRSSHSRCSRRSSSAKARTNIHASTITIRSRGMIKYSLPRSLLMPSLRQERTATT